MFRLEEKWKQASNQEEADNKQNSLFDLEDGRYTFLETYAGLHSYLRR
jgi:hypothetical protein